MKKQITNFLSKPKIIIPTFALIGIVVAALVYSHIGKSPILNISLQTNSPEVAISGSTIDLSFPKSGRLSELLVKNNQVVTKGEI